MTMLLENIRRWIWWTMNNYLFLPTYLWGNEYGEKYIIYLFQSACLLASKNTYVYQPLFLLKFLNVTNSLTIWFFKTRLWGIKQSFGTFMNKYFNVYIPLPLLTTQIVRGEPFLYQIYQPIFHWTYWLFFGNNGKFIRVLQVLWIWQYRKEMLNFFAIFFSSKCMW